MENTPCAWYIDMDTWPAHLLLDSIKCTKFMFSATRGGWFNQPLYISISFSIRELLSHNQNINYDFIPSYPIYHNPT